MKLNRFEQNVFVFMVKEIMIKVTTETRGPPDHALMCQLLTHHFRFAWVRVSVGA